MTTEAAEPGPLDARELAGHHPTRRAMLAGLAGAVGGGALGVGVTLSAQPSDGGAAAASSTTPSDRVPAYGRTQAGIARPATPQPFGLIAVADLDNPSDLTFLAGLGEAIAALVADSPRDLLPDGPASLTVTVGLGPRVVAAHRSTWPGGQALPHFAHDQAISSTATGGDLLLAAYASDPNVLAPVLDHLAQLVPTYRPRWSQRCFRGPGQGTIVRNPLGFHDGIQVPRTDHDLNDNVWLDPPAAGGTICVIRRLRLNVEGFHGLSVVGRERVVGRGLDGSPLSGGAPFSAVNLDAKTPTGEYLIPVDAHVRAAHPSFTGSHLMLRRGYGYDNGNGDAGLMFICFQRDLRSFVMTQRRLDQLDALMRYVTPSASATFLVLPGYTAHTPLGEGLT